MRSVGLVHESGLVVGVATGDASRAYASANGRSGDAARRALRDARAMRVSFKTLCVRERARAGERARARGRWLRRGRRATRRVVEGAREGGARGDGGARRGATRGGGAARRDA